MSIGAKDETLHINVSTTSARHEREINIADLLGSHSEIIIKHEDQRYRLRITSNNKLILTK